jgi:sterol desaturase/sphingolipid hydroxylase (fatty acid hydroxylase superfamily)
MTPEQIIVLVTPVFLGAIALEWVLARRKGQPALRLNDALNSISLGIISQLAGVFSKLLMVGIYSAVWAHAAPFPLPADAAWVWLLGLLVYDLSYYGLHRAGHRVALLWAAHGVHHQSEEYNLSTALRQTGTGWVASWLFYLPMALLGFPPLVFVVVGLVDLLYQFWVHTRLVGSLGWFDRWFCSPSNHRVHHAVNDRYLDCNYGGIFMVWDRLFGSFVPEDAPGAGVEPIVYGTRKPLRSWNPLWANLEGYATLARISAQAERWPDKLRVWWMPPGWRPADVAQHHPEPPFDLQRAAYDPPASRPGQAVAVGSFLAALGATSVLLWRAHDWPLPVLAGGALGVLALLTAANRSR